MRKLGAETTQNKSNKEVLLILESQNIHWDMTPYWYRYGMILKKKTMLKHFLHANENVSVIRKVPSFISAEELLKVNESPKWKGDFLLSKCVNEQDEMYSKFQYAKEMSWDFSTKL